MAKRAVFVFQILCFAALLLVCFNCKSLANDWFVFAVEANAARTQETVQKTTNNHSNYRLQDEKGHPVFPSSVLRAGNDLYFLGPQSLWWCLGAKTERTGEDSLILRQITPPLSGLSIAWQEANDFIYLSKRQSIVVLDKSGDLFEYRLSGESDKRWRVLRANGSKLGPPDPEYIAMCEYNDSILLLDPERNQIWMQTRNSANLQALLPGVLAWKLRAGDTNITNGISIGYFNGQVYVLRRNGVISRFSIKYGAKHYGKSSPTIFCYANGQLNYHRHSCIRPSRLSLGEDDYLYVVDREALRVLKVAIATGIVDEFNFPSSCDLRGLVKAGDGFWIISGDHLIYKANKSAEVLTNKVETVALDKRLRGLILPIAGQGLPSHAGVYPGARRLYRFGVHNGLDLFNQPGARIPVITGTPVRAACAGRIVRADLSYSDMNYATYNRVMNECYLAHQTSTANEDLLRGCQVWIDSGNGLLTKYAHLSKANARLHVGDSVKQGETIGYVGVSGTGENLPGRARYPHLHFEIWLDGKYLGYGLTPPETMSLFEDIFMFGKR